VIKRSKYQASSVHHVVTLIFDELYVLTHLFQTLNELCTH